jgi:hypothetical protein
VQAHQVVRRKFELTHCSQYTREPVVVVVICHTFVNRWSETLLVHWWRK